MHGSGGTRAQNERFKCTDSTEYAIKENGIVSLDHKSCASITVQCLVDAGITDWRTAFNMQINHAKKLGQMPDDIKVMRETLKAFGFVMQSTQVEDIRVQELLNKLGRLGRPAILLSLPTQNVWKKPR